MNKLSIVFAGALLMAASCANNSNKCDCNCSCPGCTCNQDKPADKAKLDYRVVDNKNVDISKFPVDKDGYIVLFDGKTLNGWRGYGMDTPPKSWTVEDGAIKLKGSGTGEAQVEGGGDLIFAS